MPRLFLQSESTAAERRFPVYLVDATDGITPETGEAAGQPQISKAGGAWANTSATLTAIGNGAYYVELTATELNTLGMLQVRYKSANTAEFNMDAQVVAFDPNDAVRAGLTALPNAAAAASGGLLTFGTGTGQLNPSGGAVALTAAAVQAIWDALTSALTVVGSIGKRLVDNIDAAVTSRMATYTQPTGFLAATFPGTVASPTNITAGTITTVTNLTNAPTNGDLTATMKASINGEADTALADAGVTGTRMGYLDKLNITGNVAGSAEVTAIQNNTRVVRVVPMTFERPDTGTTVFRIEVLLYDETGNMEAPDSAPTIGVVNQSGTSRDANLDNTTMSLVSTGRYRSTYTMDTAHALEQLIFAFSVVEGGATRTYANTGQVVDTTAVDFTAADRTKLDTLHDSRLTSSRATALDNLDALISSRATPAQVKTQADQALADVGATSTVFGRVDVATSSRLATASYTAPLTAATTRDAVGLAAANLDTQLAALATAAALSTAQGNITTILTTTSKLDDLVEDAGGGNYILTVDALQNAPSGGGGGGTDWSSTERAQMRYWLGVDGSESAPATNSPALVDAVKAAIEAIDIDGKTFKQAMQILCAVSAGDCVDAGAGSATFKGLDGATTRVVGTYDSSGDRTATYSV